MDKKLWNLYKSNSEKQCIIKMFNPNEVNDLNPSCQQILEYAAKHWSMLPFNSAILDDIDLIDINFQLQNIGDFTMEGSIISREAYSSFIDEFELKRLGITEEKTIILLNDDKDVLLPKSNYRAKASLMEPLSLWLYFNFEFFKPMLLSQRFDIILRNCDALGIDMPQIPNSKNYKAYLMYYYDICVAWHNFQVENDLTDEEFCACLYDFADMYSKEIAYAEMPTPTNVWLTGASGEDFDFLDSNENSLESVWACNERTRRGDIVIIYCKSPRSYIHSIWRAKSGGIFNPFDYYHCRTTVCDGTIIPQISYNDLKADEYFSKVPIVRKNLQGINGVSLTAEDYAQLQRLIKEKGGNPDVLPKLFDSNGYKFEGIGNGKEKDVEEKILIPALRMLGYEDSDWTRQLKIKKGRKESEIPDFVFFPRGDKHFEYAPFIIEAKLDMSSVVERRKAFDQGRSYAQGLHASYMGICDKERIIIYEANNDGSYSYSNPIFEKSWAAIFCDDTIGADLKKIVGKENIKAIKVK